MRNFTTFVTAADAAESYFKRTFGYEGVSVDYACGKRFEFYSHGDPAMDDTFSCIIDDGFLYSCKNGGELVAKTEPK